MNNLIQLGVAGFVSGLMIYYILYSKEEKRINSQLLLFKTNS
ncbi:MAG: hypothetical protein ABI390_03970 [Daejeonella sp.]